MLPILLYYLFIIFASRDERNDFITIFAGALFSQFLASLLVLFFSRVREYYADYFAGKVYNPLYLISSLIKISAQDLVIKEHDNSPIKTLYIYNKNEKDKQILSFLSKFPDLKKGLEELKRKEKEFAIIEWFSTHPSTYKRILRLYDQYINKS